MGEQRWLSVEEIAIHLGISKETIYRLLEREKIPAHRVGRLWKFRASEVDQWVLEGGPALPSTIYAPRATQHTTSPSEDTA